jgi:hypothetical protein
MAWDAGFHFDWESLDRARLETEVRKVASQYEGVVATRNPAAVETDPDEYVRPGYEDQAGEGDSDDPDDEVTWFFGFPKGKRLAWARINFGQDEDGCRASISGSDVDPACEEAFFELYEHLRDSFGGKDDPL